MAGHPETVLCKRLNDSWGVWKGEVARRSGELAERFWMCSGVSLLKWQGKKEIDTYRNSDQKGRGELAGRVGMTVGGGLCAFCGHLD